MRINHNIPALNAHRMLNRNSSASETVLERLSSGRRINRAADDAAGMAISEKMKAQVNGLKMASRNSLDGVSLIQTAEGAMNETHAMLQRMRELAVQASNGIYQGDDLEAIQNEVNELVKEIDNIAKTTQFNGKKISDGSIYPEGTVIDDDGTATLEGKFIVDSGKKIWLKGELDGIIINPNGGVVVKGQTIINSDGVIDSLLEIDKDIEVGQAPKITIKIDGNGKINLPGNITINSNRTVTLEDGTVIDPNLKPLSLQLQIGANAGEVMKFELVDIKSEVLGTLNINGTRIESGKSIKDIKMTTNKEASASIVIIDDAIKQISDGRSKLGAIQNRLEHTIANVDNAAENLTQAFSRIEDADMALEMSDFTKYNVLMQAGTAMLAQANQRPQMVLQLLGN